MSGDEDDDLLEVNDDNDAEDFRAALDDFLESYCRDIGVASVAAQIAVLRDKIRELKEERE